MPLGITTGFGAGGLGGGFGGVGVATWAGAESGFCAASGGGWFASELVGDDGLLLVQADGKPVVAADSSTKIVRTQQA